MNDRLAQPPPPKPTTSLNCRSTGIPLSPSLVYLSSFLKVHLFSSPVISGSLTNCDGDVQSRCRRVVFSHLLILQPLCFLPSLPACAEGRGRRYSRVAAFLFMSHSRIVPLSGSAVISFLFPFPPSPIPLRPYSFATVCIAAKFVRQNNYVIAVLLFQSSLLLCARELHTPEYTVPTNLPTQAIATAAGILAMSRLLSSGLVSFGKKKIIDASDVEAGTRPSAGRDGARMRRDHIRNEFREATAS